MIKSLSLAVVALVLMAGSAFANDVIGTSDIEGLNVADNTVVESSLDSVDLNSIGDKNDEAVEACFRGWFGGHCGYNYGCYNYCYNHCYTPVYHYCYQPVVYQTYCYRPVCYSYYSYPSLCGWGCY